MSNLSKVSFAGPAGRKKPRPRPSSAPSTRQISSVVELDLVPPTQLNDSQVTVTDESSSLLLNEQLSISSNLLNKSSRLTTIRPINPKKGHKTLLLKPLLPLDRSIDRELKATSHDAYEKILPTDSFIAPDENVTVNDLIDGTDKSTQPANCSIFSESISLDSTSEKWQNFQRLVAEKQKIFQRPQTAISNHRRYNFTAVFETTEERERAIEQDRKRRLEYLRPPKAYQTKQNWRVSATEFLKERLEREASDKTVGEVESWDDMSASTDINISNQEQGQGNVKLERDLLRYRYHIDDDGEEDDAEGVTPSVVRHAASSPPSILENFGKAASNKFEIGSIFQNDLQNSKYHAIYGILPLSKDLLFPHRKTAVAVVAEAAASDDDDSTDSSREAVVEPEATGPLKPGVEEKMAAAMAEWGQLKLAGYQGSAQRRRKQIELEGRDELDQQETTPPALDESLYFGEAAKIKFFCAYQSIVSNAGKKVKLLPPQQ